MSTLSPELRRLRSATAAHVKHSKHDPAEECTAMRAALWRRYEAQVDPDGLLTIEERHRRAKSLMRADLLRRSYQSAKVRAQRAEDALADALIGAGGAA